MTENPKVSVVMGVFNEADNLAGTLDGILGQRAVELELIVVDDGSTDGTADLLASYAKRDRRLRVVRQENAGLTAALVRGCAAARGEFIARHDAGDISHEDRLARQVAALEARPDAVMVACATRFIAPEGEPLHCVTFDDEKIAANLGDLDGRQHIPHHGSAMMRRRIYEKVGGYRTLFPVAQDYDLWTRLFEQGACLGLTQELYSARLMPGSISATRRGLQEESSRVIAMAARSRREGGSEQPILDEWRIRLQSGERDRTTKRKRPRKLAADWNYFIGCLLRKSAPNSAARYFRRAVNQDRLHLRSWLRLIQCRLAA